MSAKYKKFMNYMQSGRSLKLEFNSSYAAESDSTNIAFKYLVILFLIIH